MAGSTFRTEIFGTSVEMIADWSQSSSSIWMRFGEGDSYCTGRQVADFGHQRYKAMRHFLDEYITEGGDDPEDFEKEIDDAIESMADDTVADDDE